MLLDDDWNTNALRRPSGSLLIFPSVRMTVIYVRNYLSNFFTRLIMWYWEKGFLNVEESPQFCGSITDTGVMSILKAPDWWFIALVSPITCSIVDPFRPAEREASVIIFYTKYINMVHFIYQSEMTFALPDSDLCQLQTDVNSPKTEGKEMFAQYQKSSMDKVGFIHQRVF